MAREYSIYRITSPSGKYYIGLTSMDLRERWRKHQHRAFKEARNHPFYNAIRKYGPEAFTVEIIDKAYGKQDAQQKERKQIAAAPKDRLYNISPGGEADGPAGSKVFWDRLRKDPEAYATYIAKLSETKLACDHTDYVDLLKRAEEWRVSHPKEAWRIQYRGQRCARKTRKRHAPKPPERSLKERLLIKHKIGEKRRRDVTRIWAERTPEEKKEIGRKISVSQKVRMQTRAVLPDFNPLEWPYAKATVLRKLRQGMNREEIITDAIRNVESRSSHWREVKINLRRMGVTWSEPTILSTPDQKTAFSPPGE
ncbi:MAG: GIY-YIG nuclease family protein [Bacteroidales bacterium]|nr:GIY-YIG nuclease family protein [Bacteroidales bacterium]